MSLLTSTGRKLMEGDLLSEHPATPKSDTPPIETPVDDDMPTSVVSYLESQLTLKFFKELYNAKTEPKVPNVPAWKIKLDKRKAARRADFDLKNTLSKCPHADLRSS